MGTRGLTCVVKDGVFRVAQYGQYDHYPSGQGRIIAEFLASKEFDLELFNSQVDKIEILDSAAADALWDTKEGCHFLGRSIGGKILEHIFITENPRVFLNTEFAKDGLFCEYIYVVDLDNNVLECHQGCEGPPVPGERFYSEDQKKSDYSVKFVAKTHIQGIVPADFVSLCEAKDE